LYKKCMFFAPPQAKGCFSRRAYSETRPEPATAAWLEPPLLSETIELTSFAEFLPLTAHVTSPFDFHGVVPVCITVIVVGAFTEVASGVQLKVIEVGFAAIPIVETCATLIAKRP